MEPSPIPPPCQRARLGDPTPRWRRRLRGSLARNSTSFFARKISPTTKNRLPKATRSASSSGRIGSRLPSGSPCTPLSAAAKILLSRCASSSSSWKSSREPSPATAPALLPCSQRCSSPSLLFPLASGGGWPTDLRQRRKRWLGSSATTGRGCASSLPRRLGRRRKSALLHSIRPRIGGRSMRSRKNATSRLRISTGFWTASSEPRRRARRARAT